MVSGMDVAALFVWAPLRGGFCSVSVAFGSVAPLLLPVLSAVVIVRGKDVTLRWLQDQIEIQHC